MFELDSFKVTHAMRYPSPIMSIGLSADCRLLAVGTSDGMLSVRKHQRHRRLKPAAKGLCSLGGCSSTVTQRLHSSALSLLAPRLHRTLHLLASPALAPCSLHLSPAAMQKLRGCHFERIATRRWKRVG